ncbi:unnamed protein product, partial [marine sediment metagenome]
AGEIARYHVGDLLVLTAFANAVNNLPGYYVVSVTVNVGDLDIVLDPVNNVLVGEVAGGARSIELVTRSMFNYAAGATQASMASYTDWRNPNDTELASLRDMEAATAAPDAGMFPGWPAAIWSATTEPSVVANAMEADYVTGELTSLVKTSAVRAALVRG